MQATKDYEAISVVAHGNSYLLGTFILGDDVCHFTHGRWKKIHAESALKDAENNKACRRCDQQGPDICRREGSH